MWKFIKFCLTEKEMIEFSLEMDSGQKMKMKNFVNLYTSKIYYI